MNLYRTSEPAIFVCCHTPHHEYVDAAERLQSSFRRYAPNNLLFTKQLEHTGSWVGNCGLKPGFIRDQLRDFKDRAVVWVDADAELICDAGYFDGLAAADVDFAAHMPDPKRKPDRINSRLLSGTLYFGPGPMSRALVERWCKLQADAPAMLDQESLYDAIREQYTEAGPCLKFVNLPRRYVCIRDLMPEVPFPAIVHHQLSRTMRERV